jgi:hypothetical protein
VRYPANASPVMDAKETSPLAGAPRLPTPAPLWLDLEWRGFGEASRSSRRVVTDGKITWGFFLRVGDIAVARAIATRMRLGIQ